MSRIGKRDRIVITPTDVTVNGERTTKFLGQEIYEVGTLSQYFTEIQNKVIREYGIQPIEMQISSSKTNGHQGVLGEPSPKHGKHAWSTLVFEHNVESRCLFQVSHRSTAECAREAAAYCVEEVLLSSALRKTLVYSAARKILKNQDSLQVRQLLSNFRPMVWDPVHKTVIKR